MSRVPATAADRQALQQAADWVARLDSPDCTEAERARFERWCAADPMHALAYREAGRTWEESRALIRNSLELGRATRHALRDTSQRRPWAGRWLAAASIAVVFLGAGAFLYRMMQRADPLPVGTRHATLAGEQRRVVLSDGSVLVLDTQTVLVERYTRGQRRVDIQAGQAQFEVQGNPARPFVVHALAGTVTAVGTRFQVRLGDDDATVTLLEGKVRVAASANGRAGQAALLEAGQSLQLTASGGLGAVHAADARVADGWVDGKLYVDDWRLQDFVAEINRYSDVRLRIDDPALADIRISGVFQTRNRDGLDRLLAQGWGIQSREVAPGEVLLVRGTAWAR